MEATYIGRTERYNKHREYWPMTIKHGKVYDIVVDYTPDIRTGWIWVYIIENGYVRTQIPYRPHLLKKYWKFE